LLSRKDNNTASFSPSFRPLRGLHSSVHGAVLSPRFYLAHYCKVPLSAFLALRFPSSLSKENKNNVSLSVTRLLVAYPPLSSLSVAPVGLAPRSLVPPIDTLFLFPGIYRNQRRSTKERLRSRIPSPFGINQFVAHPCAPHLHSGTPHFGHPGLVLPCPHSALSPTPYKGTLIAFPLHCFSNLSANSLLVRFQAYRQHATCRR
jgi:hypothetical protein